MLNDDQRQGCTLLDLKDHQYQFIEKDTRDEIGVCIMMGHCLQENIRNA